MKKIRITQIKSGIDRSVRQKKTLIALGLNKLHATKEVEYTPQISGMINKVSHLVIFEEIDNFTTIENTKAFVATSSDTKEKIQNPIVNSTLDIKPTVVIEEPVQATIKESVEQSKIVQDIEHTNDIVIETVPTIESNNLNDSNIVADDSLNVTVESDD